VRDPVCEITPATVVPVTPDELRELLTPELDLGLITPLGYGVDHVAFEADDLVIRCSRVADPDSLIRDVAVLAAVAEYTTLPIPHPVLIRPEQGVLVYEKIPGGPAAAGERLPEPFAETIGAFLARLHTAPVAELRDLAGDDADPPQTWLADARTLFAECREQIPKPRRIEAFLAEPTPPPCPEAELVFSHNDLGAEHVLVDDERVTGVIDWSDAAITDPAYDLGLLLRDTGPQVFEAILAAYGRTDDALAARALFYARCAAIEDLAYGLRSGRDIYTRNALRALQWL
jgi:aminoglycoside phosphotransferase (APT) family kinase protein